MNDRSLLEPSWRERMVHANGIDLHVIEAGDPGAPLLLLLHGFPEFWWAWRGQLTPLAEAGFHVVAPDLRGFNLSSAPSGVSAYGLDILTADVLALASALGAERFFLAGHDWGAVVSWSLAALCPERLERVICIAGPHPRVWAREVFASPLQFLRSAYIAFFQLPGLPEFWLGFGRFNRLKAAIRRSARGRRVQPGMFEPYEMAWARPSSLTGMLNYYRALPSRREQELAARIDLPVLVVWGGKDRFLGRKVMESSAALCPNGLFVPIEEATHWLHWENPERVTAEMLRFLRNS